MHRLTQAIIRTRLTSGQTDVTQAQAVDLLRASHPASTKLPSSWPEWARLLPHLLALDPDTNTQELASLSNSAAWYLIRRGLPRDAERLARRLYQNHLAQHGPDATPTLNTANILAVALDEQRRHSEARELDEDTLARRRRVLGEDHPDTLISANNLALRLAGLGENQAARELDEDTLARRRRVLGDDHPQTLSTANNLASRLAESGEHQAARMMNEDTLARFRRVLGEDHPDTLISASNLASRLAGLGEYQAARELDEDTLARRRRVLGDRPP